MIDFKDLKIGMTIQDSEGNIGTIINIEDIHNVHIEYYNGLRSEIEYGGMAILCFDPECEFYEEDASIV
jgi:hypothetical protein